MALIRTPITHQRIDELVRGSDAFLFQQMLMELIMMDDPRRITMGRAEFAAVLTDVMTHLALGAGDPHVVAPHLAAAIDDGEMGEPTSTFLFYDLAKMLDLLFPVHDGGARAAAAPDIPPR